MRLFRSGIVVAMILMCIPRKVQAFENTICSICNFHCIINDVKNVWNVEEKEYGTDNICNQK